eukprot:757727-Amphidinium_carterae.1
MLLFWPRRYHHSHLQSGKQEEPHKLQDLRQQRHHPGVHSALHTPRIIPAALAVLFSRAATLGVKWNFAGQGVVYWWPWVTPN